VRVFHEPGARLALTNSVSKDRRSTYLQRSPKTGQSKVTDQVRDIDFGERT
jgi:hypothetical protein